ncbi:hypothetical protein GCM10020295_13910 [Streptomyces cinereospinus]
MSERRAAPTVGQVVLGKRLQELREAAGLKREEAARVLRVAPATVRRMETAEVALRIPYLQILLPAYGVPEAEVTAFVTLAEEANRPGWWQRFSDVLPDWFSVFVSLEGAARMIRSYEPHFVPGLLQTEDYARAVLDAGTIGQSGGKEMIERHVSLRLARQELLRRPDAPHLWVIMDETVLRGRSAPARRSWAPSWTGCWRPPRATGSPSRSPSSSPVRTRGRTPPSRCSASPSRSCRTWSSPST